jgi:hypothetical protein
MKLDANEAARMVVQGFESAVLCLEFMKRDGVMIIFSRKFRGEIAERKERLDLLRRELESLIAKAIPGGGVIEGNHLEIPVTDGQEEMKS